MKSIYLDYAAATPPDKRVVAAMEPYFRDHFYNPSATYSPARAVLTDLNQARASISHHLGAHANEIIFTSGGTEANNLAVNGVMTRYPGKQVLISAIEHESVLAPAGVYNHQLLSVDKQGLLDLEKLQKNINDQTVLISVMQANNEIGVLQPLTKIAGIIKTVRTDRQRRKIDLPLYFHTDATQAANYLDLHVHRLGVDMMTLNGGKIYGPKGAGALFAHSGVTLSAQISGGGQQRNIRSGTENVAGVIGLAMALDIAQNMRVEESKRLTGLRNYMIKHLENLIPDIIINGSQKHRLPNNVHITIPGNDNERILMLLDARGIYAAAGSACSAITQASSPVLKAIGLSEEAARSSLRFTMGRSTRQTDIKYIVETLAGLLKSNP